MKILLNFLTACQSMNDYAACRVGYTKVRPYNADLTAKGC